MNPKGKVLELVANCIEHACSRETSSDAAGWSPENPTYGHCALAVAFIQEAYGGDFLRYDLAGTSFAAMRSHYKNRLPDGTVFDATEKQFQGRIAFADLPEPLTRMREEILDPVKYPETVRRYKEFRARVGEQIELMVCPFIRELLFNDSGKENP